MDDLMKGLLVVGAAMRGSDLSEDELQELDQLEEPAQASQGLKEKMALVIPNLTSEQPTQE